MKKAHHQKPSKSKARLIDLRDEALSRCHKIGSLSELLCHCSIECLHPDVIVCASGVISQESKKLRENLEALCKRLPQTK